MYGRGLRALSLASAALIATTYGLVFFYAPNDGDQGFIQKIFYIHVPLAITVLCGFVVAGVFGVLYLRTRDERWDRRAYVTIHLGIVFGVGVLVTGSIWAKASWGKWWVWDEPTLVSFLIVFLLYACYQPLRFSIEDRDRQARYAAVFAITAGAFVPLNFIAVRLATSLVHPRVLGTTAGGMPGSMRLTFLVALVAVATLYVTLAKLELTSKHVGDQLRRLRRAVDEPATGATGSLESPVARVPARPTLEP